MRNKAVKKLKKWFSARQEPFSEPEMMRLWKGLYYCFWMSDKPLVQEELAENISSFVSCFKSPDSALLFVKSFLLTMGREWVGIDKWRTEKFMMFTRRFLRSSFKFLSSNSWDESLVKQTASIFQEDVILCLPPRTSVDFQLHFTDVFLEELAKVAGQNLSTDILDIFLLPFITVVRQCDEKRLRDHVVERIFNHLLRQSDPGIKWQNEEFEQEDEEEEELNEENTNEEDDGVESEQEEEEMVAPEDPRAGGVDAVIPQLSVDYLRLSEKMFELGSEEGVKNISRKALFNLSKMFKDVAENVFPLGPNFEDDEDIPNIKVSKETKKLMRETQEARKKSQQEKVNFKKALKAQANTESEQNGVVESNGTNGDVESDEDEESPAESSETPAEESKASSKELKRKRKREQKRKKKERLRMEASDNELKEKKSKEMIDQDIQRVNSVASNIEDKERKYQEKQLKLKEVDQKKKKKQNSQEKSDASSLITERTEAVVELNGTDSSETESKKKKKKKKKKEAVEDVTMESSATPEEDVMKDTILQPNLATLESFEKIKKKKEKMKAKEKKPLYRIDSDIAFNAPSLSQINLMQLDDKKIDHIPDQSDPSNKESQEAQANTQGASAEDKVGKKKKMKKYNAETSLLIDARDTLETEQSQADQSVSKPKKKKKCREDSVSVSVSSSGASPKSSKMFEEDNCWGDLEPGETEIVLPNKKYKGQIKLSPAEELQSPMVTPAKTFTATFLKKALSKSEKKGEKKKLIADPNCLSEPRKKKVNVVLTKNSFQDFGQHLKSVKNSPQTPHDPSKNPIKSALKMTPTALASKSLNPVKLNTQLNGRSSTAKKLAGKNRKRAADFF